MTPAATSTPVVLTVQHPSTLSAADILDIVNSTVDTDAPVVIQALPLTADAEGKVSAYTMLGELALSVVNSIVQQIHAKHAAAVAARQ
jgi:hypothetical protein